MPKIQDAHLIALMAVICGNINRRSDLVQDFADTFSRPVRPIEHLLHYDIGTGRVVFGGNTTFPALAAWRQSNQFKPQTNESRVCIATCGIKYILPAETDTQLAFAVLHRVTEEFDKFFEEEVEDQYGGDLLNQAGLIEWAVSWSVRFGYEGPDQQTLYPTATGTFTFKHDYLFDRSKLLNVTGLYAQHNLKGVGAALIINPVLAQAVPTTQTPIVEPAPPGNLSGT